MNPKIGSTNWLGCAFGMIFGLFGPLFIHPKGYEKRPSKQPSQLVLPKTGIGAWSSFRAFGRMGQGARGKGQGARLEWRWGSGQVAPRASSYLRLKM